MNQALSTAESIRHLRNNLFFFLLRNGVAIPPVSVLPQMINPEGLKCYYDQKITFIFSSDFETMFIKHSPSEIISLNFEKKTVNLNCNFPV